MLVVDRALISNSEESVLQDFERLKETLLINSIFHNHRSVTAIGKRGPGDT